MPSLIPLTDQARSSIQGDKIELTVFPFRVGRESRSSSDHVPQSILERRLGKVPPNNDFYLIDGGRLLNISREHFLIERTENGSFVLRDRMRACGTTVRGEKGERHCRATHCDLFDGDTITIGAHSSPYVFRFSVSDNAEGLRHWVVFDAMGVVYTASDDVSDLLWPFLVLHNPNVDKKKFIDAYVRVSLGSISCPEFWERMGLGRRYPQIEQEYLDTMLTMDSEFRQAALGLHEHYKIGMLSNDVGDWSRYLRKRFDIDFFDAAVISGDVLCRKPDRKIFEKFLEKSGAMSEECIFIDDRKKNLEVAASIGFKTIWFHRIEDDLQFKPDFEIRSFLDLEYVVKTLNIIKI
jgi:HAD superfamily hydrolase (TIGR01509 family)